VQASTSRPVVDLNLLKALKGRLPAATIILLLEQITIAKCRGPTHHPYPPILMWLWGDSLRPHQQPQDQSKPRAHRHRRDQHRCGNHNRNRCRHALRANQSLLVDPHHGCQRRHHPCRQGFDSDPSGCVQLLRVNPLEFLIWWAAMLVTVFLSIDSGIYTSISASTALLLVRMAHLRRNFFRRAVVHFEGPDVKNPQRNHATFSSRFCLCSSLHW
jgi:solute carrier family 26 (sodium-independent sulfate anion transporter), member 11